MAPTTSRQAKTATKKRAPSPDSQISSQGSALAESQGAEEVQEVVEKALKQNKSKHSKRTQEITTQYKSKVTKSRQGIDGIFTTYEKDLKTLRVTQTKKLAALLKRKLVIEQKLLDSIKRLEDAYKAGAKDVQLVVRGRTEEMEKAAGGAKVVAKV
ncbi:hypothetical protein BLS_003625 [Venturia inaequalis]|uniref:Uncharacterized protein n=1 Tax=Venturia inaequalis TaxID=5025 RepID=A0A8H3UW32_VENIN|nr:hypothetical protein EG328_009215 [Venturia inaequalis]KAE9973363.1 hypothetical protein BLS_003625 [Venturia inaequalis]KAE9975829.1 hypothetical protein EG327_008319 [Venturia inaequalis]RDI79495.1 hypothetical protein Vi05172_g10418 [Venturia inaequalis]